MRLGKNMALLAALAAVVGTLGAGLASGQTKPTSSQSTAASSHAVVHKEAAPGEKLPLAEDVFKDIRVLRGMPLDEFMDTMGFFAASLAMTCTDCHTDESGGDWTKYAVETPRMATARKMVLMVNKINNENFGGARFVTCFTCHRYDASTPKVIPSLALQYGAPVDDPNEVTVSTQGPKEPSADKVFAAYTEALGGAQKLAGLTSFVVKGTYEGWDTGHEKRPLEVYAKAPAQRSTVVHLLDANDKVWTYDGHQAWIASPDKPLPMMMLTGGELEGAKFDAALSFPAQIQQAYPTWRVGETAIEDEDVYIVQGSAPGRTSVKLYFDKKSSLLVRQVRYASTKIGVIPVQIDYSDYRPVAGVKMPFRWVTTWTDGQSITLVNEIQANVPIDAKQFSKPAPAPLPTSAEAR